MLQDPEWTSLCGPLTLRLLVKQGEPQWLLTVVRCNGQEKDGELHDASEGPGDTHFY